VKELTFIRNHIEKWQRAELTIEVADSETPDGLAELYIDLTSDLAFAQTHYPQSRITVYLNKLCAELHRKIYTNKKEKWSRLITYWTDEVPLTMYENRKLFLLSFIIFGLSVLIGAVSQMFDANFCRVIMGNEYIDMTLDNIARGKPVDVYSGGTEINMFFEITLNNIMVSFEIFVSGIFTSIVTAFNLFFNSVSVGCLEVLFFQHGYLEEGMLAVFLHGTLELSAIIISSAAGMAMGNGWLFPGTYSRFVSFQRGARRGMKIVVGTVPIFVCAGFIESFLTRHTETSLGFHLTIIIFSLIFVIGYFVLLPIKKHKKLNYGTKKTENRIL
jgi:uncharacterized membrane protein SpoIIM required for sporulation